jgi:hypothetical protein
MGLLDMFGIDDSGQTPEQQAALKRGLLTAGLAMMGTKGSLGTAMSRGGLLGMQAYDDAQTQQRQQQLGNMQMQSQRLQLEQAQQAAERAKQLQGLRQQYSKSPAQQALAGGGGPTQANAQAMQGMRPQFDSEGYGNALMQIDPEAGHAFLKSIAKQDTDTVYDSEGRQVTIDRRTGRPVVTGAPKLPEGMVMGPNGPEYMPGYLAGRKDIAQAGATVITNGQPVIGINPATGKRELVQFGNRPGAGPVYTGVEAPPDAATTADKKQAAKEAAESKASIRDATEALALLEQATAERTGTRGNKLPSIIDTATSSGVGNLVDKGLGFFGTSTQGSQAAAQLKALEGALIAKMPKMSGPQSDKDVEMYRQAAAKIGDPTTPAGDRKAAIEAVVTIQKRAIAQAQAQAQAAAVSETTPDAPKSSGLNAGPISQAREAIAKGAPRDAVIKRLRDAGIDPKGL